MHSLDDQVTFWPRTKYNPMRRGYIYVVNSLDLHRTNPPPGEPYVRSKITFSPVFIRNVLTQIDQNCLLEPFMNKHDKFSHSIIPDATMRRKVDELFMKMALEYEKEETEAGHRAIITAYLIEMLVLIYRWYSQNREIFPPLFPARQHVEKVISYSIAGQPFFLSFGIHS